MPSARDIPWSKNADDGTFKSDDELKALCGAERVDLGDVGTCHTPAEPAASLQIASGSTSVVLYSGAGCTATWPWGSGTLAQTNPPREMLSYRVVTQ